MSPGLPFSIRPRSEGQRSRSYSDEVQKHISDDRMAGVIVYSIECPPSSYIYFESKI